MIIKSLTVTDFRVFRGRHTFDLTPRVRWNSRRPIVLFGGLNGAGKTTTLTAVRVGLYGRQSLGISTSTKKYHDFLGSCIHKARNEVLQPSTSKLELSFDYSHMGVSNEYKVLRQWTKSGKKLSESLEIFKDGKLMEGFSYEQAQGFLNELIPIGVSDLFFFDGEKISELASDQSGNALSNSIKRLLGLDLIERLNADLGVLIRNKQREGAHKDLRGEIDSLEQKLEELEALADSAEREFRDSYPEYLGAKENLEVANREFLASGGAWAVTRDQEIKNQEKLLEERMAIEKDIRSILSGNYPLSLAPKICLGASEALDLEAESLAQNLSARKIEQYVEDVQTELENILSKSQLEKVLPILGKVGLQDAYAFKELDLLHDVGGRVKSSIQAKIAKAFDQDKPRIEELSNTLASINLELDQIGERISRAPEESSINSTFEELSELQSIVRELEVQRELKREEARRYLREAADIARKLDDLYQRESGASIITGNITRAKASQKLLDSFARESAKEKTRQLEIEFAASFQRLARKDDICLKAEIDPKSFRVSLLDGVGKAVDKNDLSAGEKQIYAIAILEALAKTSGRKLPIIIDTPLGRLDSKHRENLIRNYFPTASHQVIILSTDTEVDEKFYTDLYRDMSHAYKLEYDAETGSTSAEEGYFWRSIGTEAA